MSEQPDADVLLAFAPRLAHLMRHRLRRLDPPLTYRQFRLMDHIDDGATSLTALRQRTVISLSALSETVDGLVRKDMVTRVPSERDRRGIDLALSAEGEAALALARPALDHLAHDVLAAAPAETRELLGPALRAMHDAVQSQLDVEHPR